MKKVCIIGAGTAGLCSARRALENNIEPVVYEQNNCIGGTWVYTDETTTNQYGLDVHSSMYQGLRTNLPKEVMGYPDFDIKYSDDVSYVPSQAILKFLEDYAAHFKLEKYIKLLHYVIRVRPRNDKWEVITKNLSTSEIYEESYDFVLICNGHYHTPLYPEIEGMKLFKGINRHSHEYRHAAVFKDEKVLVVGGGPSGMDLCHEIAKYAKSVTLSHHLPEKPKGDFLENLKQKPDIKVINEHGAYFIDGSYEEYTCIFYCTGYQYAFPFLSMDCGLFVQDNHVQPLYKQCMNIKYPTMALIGLPFYVCAAQMMDLQARFCFKYYSGDKDFPSQAEMKAVNAAYLKERAAEGFYGRKAHMLGPSQQKYFDDLASTAQIEGVKPVLTKLHNKSSERFLEDILHFRNDVFRIVNDETFMQIK